MSDKNVSLDLLGELLRDIPAEQRVMRAEAHETRGLLLAMTEQMRRLDRRMDELRDELELMIKAELMGRLGHFETQMEHRLDALGERMGAVELRLPS